MKSERQHPGMGASGFDPHFNIFHELMAFKVREILLVSSAYDAFIMEEDGSIARRLANEYQGLNLSSPPRITRATSAEEALEFLQAYHFDLVLTTSHLGGMDAGCLATEVKKIDPTLPVVLVIHNLKSGYPQPGSSECSPVDAVYLWGCESDLLLALIKNTEDHVNVQADTARAMVRVLIFVDDSPVYRSFLLPLIYREVVRQTQKVLDESLNDRDRLLRMRARPKILTASNFEEALALYEAYKPYVFGILSDARFPRKGEIDSDAGYRFLSYARNEVKDLPLLMLSSEAGNRERVQDLPAVFIDKNSPLLRDELHDFFMQYLGFGDFIFRLPDNSPICRAANLHEFEQELGKIPEESLRYHAENNHFSNWVMARAEVALATRLHKEHIAGIKCNDDLRDDLVFKVHALRKLRQRGVVASFSSTTYDPDLMDFVKMGEGSMGGKARGLAFMWAQLQHPGSADSMLAKMTVTIPQTCVITADGFDSFVLENKLKPQADMEDDVIASLFVQAQLPDWLRSKLRTLLQHINYPLSVRSSSLLEDAQFRPYAGLYSTYFLANNHPDFEVRFRQLEEAVKLVYASTWYESPTAFSRTCNHGSQDSMAVIIQNVVGRQYGDFWYPAISGVAQSHNFYPIMNMQADDGVVHIALGIGKTVVEGERSLRFSPTYPKKLPQFSTVEDILKNSQRQFYSLDMCKNDRLDRTGSNLVQRQIQNAENELPVQAMASTYIAEEHRIRDTAMPGVKVMTFAQIMKYEMYPLPEILTELLEVGKKGMGCDVEIEFAVRLAEKQIDNEFYFLQIRPMVTGAEQADVLIGEDEKKLAFAWSTESLGHGRFDTMTDIVYVNRAAFDPAATRTIALEVGRINRILESEQRPYLLIGPGRWGTADPWLGIPVQWSDISGVGAMIEVRNDTLRADASQGSHFFQNITSLGIPYLTVTEGAESGDDFLRWAFLDEQSLVGESAYVRHIRLEKPFILQCNGRKSEGVVFVPAA